MSATVTPRQCQILNLCLKSRMGLSTDEIASALNISRNAIQQHLSCLEKNNFIQQGDLKKTAGRPIRTFVLTETGLNFFPKQYAWFSELILSDLKNELGDEAFKSYLHKLGSSLANNLSARFDGKEMPERIDELVQVMNELGYQATNTSDTKTGDLYIEACNCIYHDLAQKHNEICELDITLIADLLEREIEAVECMAKGEHICRFKINDCKKT